MNKNKKRVKRAFLPWITSYTISPRIAFWTTLLIFLLADFVPAFSFNLLFDTVDYRGFLSDWNFFFIDFILIPTLVYWYMVGPKKIANFWKNLEQFDAINIQYQTLEKAKRRIRTPFLVIGGAFICLIGLWSGYWSNSFLTPQPWYFANWFVRVVRLSTWGIGFYLGGVVVLREMQTLFGLRNVFQNCSVKLLPYHPDKNNGFGFIVEYLMRFVSLSALLGAALSIWIVWLWLEGYLVLRMARLSL
jgi:hypothetical protein